MKQGDDEILERRKGEPGKVPIKKYFEQCLHCCVDFYEVVK